MALFVVLALIMIMIIWLFARADSSENNLGVQAAALVRDDMREVYPTTTTTTEKAPEPVQRAAKPRPSRSRVAASGGGSPNLAALRQCENRKQCELGNCYQSAPGDYYRGAYQFERRTWNGVLTRMAEDDPQYHKYVGTDPADAPSEVQDAAARRLFSERGTQPWPDCGWRMRT